MTRRANNEGALFRRKDGRWCARLKVDGKMRYYYAHTRRACQVWLFEIRRQIGDGLLMDGGRLLVSEYLDYWLETARPSLRPGTWHQYDRIIHNHIIPALGDIRLEELRPVQLQGLYNRYQQPGQPASIGQIIHTILHRALGQAVRWQLLARNPTDAVIRPRIPRHEMRALSDGQVRQLLEAARGDRFEALWTLAVTTGMRCGELLGLRWSDVDLERGEISVRRQVQRVPGQGLVFSDLKTGKSRRAVALGAAVIDVLRKHREQQGAKADLVFCTHVGTPVDARNLRDFFKDLLSRAGLPDIRFHDLRHTAASLMLQQGIHPKVVQERLGHANPVITLDRYSHVVPDMQQQAATAMDAILVRQL